jgi:hypothetical protein
LDAAVALVLNIHVWVRSFESFFQICKWKDQAPGAKYSQGAFCILNILRRMAGSREYQPYRQEDHAYLAYGEFGSFGFSYHMFLLYFYLGNPFNPG